MTTSSVKSILKNQLTPNFEGKAKRNVRFSEILDFDVSLTPQSKRKLADENENVMENGQSSKKTRFSEAEENEQPDEYHIDYDSTSKVSAKVSSWNEFFKNEIIVPKLIVESLSNLKCKARRRKTASGATIVIKRLRYDDSFSPLQDINCKNSPSSLPNSPVNGPSLSHSPSELYTR